MHALPQLSEARRAIPLGDLLLGLQLLQERRDALAQSLHL
jgi:hypothetical protein